MLSKHLAKFSNQWPVSSAEESLNDIRQIKESDKPPVLLSKDDYDASYVEPKILFNPETNSVEHATVFQLSNK